MTRNESNQVQTVATTPGPTGTAGWRTIAIGTMLVFFIAYAVFEGMHSRVEATAELRHVAMSSAIPSVNVVYPKDGTEAEE